MTMQYNKNPISLREGSFYLNGIEVVDMVKAEVKATPETWTGKVIGDKTPSTRWIGLTITGNVTRFRTTNQGKQMIKHYLDTGETPELTLVGIANDKNSDYYKTHGTDKITVVGCVVTSDILLMLLDAEGDVLKETFNFNAKSIL